MLGLPGAVLVGASGWEPRTPSSEPADGCPVVVDFREVPVVEERGAADRGVEVVRRVGGGEAGGHASAGAPLGDPRAPSRRPCFGG